MTDVIKLFTEENRPEFIGGCMSCGETLWTICISLGEVGEAITLNRITFECDNCGSRIVMANDEEYDEFEDPEEELKNIDDILYDVQKKINIISKVLDEEEEDKKKE